MHSQNYNLTPQSAPSEIAFNFLLCLRSNKLVFRGQPVDIFTKLHEACGVETICFEQDCEPIWMSRDEAVKAWCETNDVDFIESVGHTLWNPHEVIDLNGGSPPITFSMFNHVVSSIGLPQRPLPDVDLPTIALANLTPDPDFYLLSGTI
jgi:deoxyribodipyrimidine photolyase